MLRDELEDLNIDTTDSSTMGVGIYDLGIIGCGAARRIAAVGAEEEEEEEEIKDSIRACWKDEFDPPYEDGLPPLAVPAAPPAPVPDTCEASQESTEPLPVQDLPTFPAIPPWEALRDLVRETRERFDTATGPADPLPPDTVTDALRRTAALARVPPAPAPPKPAFLLKPKMPQIPPEPKAGTTEYYAQLTTILDSIRAYLGRPRSGPTDELMAAGWRVLLMTTQTALDAHIRDPRLELPHLPAFWPG